MYFLVDNINKVIFGWSAKCGCSHIKKLYQFLAKKKHNWVHMQQYYSSPFPESFSGYTIFIILRNPYDRIVSGYLDKYSEEGHYYHQWTKELPALTYRNFVDEICKNEYKVIHRHHFTPQLSEDWDKFQNTLINNPPKETIVYDISKIDYSYIESLYGVKISDDVLEFRGDHINKRNETINYPVYDLVQTEFLDKKPTTQCFYNEEIAAKFEQFYKVDFDFAKSHGINYQIKKQ